MTRIQCSHGYLPPKDEWETDDVVREDGEVIEVCYATVCEDCGVQLSAYADPDVTDPAEVDWREPPRHARERTHQNRELRRRGL